MAFYNGDCVLQTAKSLSCHYQSGEHENVFSTPMAMSRYMLLEPRFVSDNYTKRRRCHPLLCIGVGTGSSTGLILVQINSRVMAASLDSHHHHPFIHLFLFICSAQQDAEALVCSSVVSLRPRLPPRDAHQDVAEVDD
ncbi:hypothetical protein MGYG_05257 [Nannizzia gypsea CBS 118893]|uniref:Uncharacterized protein n=1 Tax=Arthroderma gypseum (strain ATCC MYA-4604 / CBS 118893) TaxID=535722 RepID=E4UVC9_ARTGP|nr:hypothetical protein MGYG_05257 [Nannizzia gypsea CBS 118893]EFR02256.1 hypothetical protein MGYG_05257 [Nannizzia gypsea CBS 118893]